MVHQYRSNGYNIVLDVDSGSVHIVDDLVYDIINTVKQDPSCSDESVIEAYSGQYPESDVREALAKPLEAIAESVKKVLENTPPELSADILDNGIVITGGGALLGGIDLYISNKTSLPVRVADTPLDCVALGVGKFCEL